MRAFFLAWSGVSKKLTQAVSETKMRIASKKLPVDFQGSLPTVEEIEAELAGAVPLKPERKKNKT